MSEYTKEQEAAALRAVEAPDVWKGWTWDVVRTMAKRTAAAEQERDALRAELKRLRRIERAAKAWVKSMDDIHVPYPVTEQVERKIRAALKKGGRK